jgi:hypothetical protein
MTRSEMIEMMARAMCARNYPNGTLRDMDMMWEGWTCDAQAALTALEAAGVVQTWQDIATAPRDGTPFLALWPYHKDWQSAFETRWDAGEDWTGGDAPGWYAHGWGHILDGYSPTHWMPLPASPMRDERGV